MLENIIPNYLQNIFKNLTEQDINEIRIRKDKPICAICNTKTFFINENGLCSSANSAVFGTQQILEDIIIKASEHSIYSVNEQIKQGFLMVDGGIRIGICGEIAFDNNIKTIKNFTSICIRIPHRIKNISLPIFSQILDNGEINNTLIVSPAGAGKTTMLRDIIFQLSSHNYPFNVFIADERGEINCGNKRNFIGSYFYDSLCFFNKYDSIMMGIRTMSPDLIVTDELGYEKDFEAIKYASTCGAKVIATIHASSIEELKNKSVFEGILNSKLFKRYIFLSKENGLGTISGIYDQNLSRIYGLRL